MEHANLHSYLEHRFAKEPIVTDAMVVEAKKEYRKCYQEKYRKQYREKNVQVTFRLSKMQYRKIQREAKERNLKTGLYAKRKVLEKSEGSTNTKSIRILLLRAIDLLEEYQVEGNPLSITGTLGHLGQLLDRLE